MESRCRHATPRRPACGNRPGPRPHRCRHAGLGSGTNRARPRGACWRSTATSWGVRLWRRSSPLDEDAPSQLPDASGSSAERSPPIASLHHYRQNALQKGTRCAGKHHEDGAEGVAPRERVAAKTGQATVHHQSAAQNGASSFNSKAEGAQQGEGTAHIVGARRAWGWCKFYILRPTGGRSPHDLVSRWPVPRALREVCNAG
jgi:hypothetical protein